MAGWRDSFTELINFIKSHPSIGITQSMVIIPDEVRSEFYRLFNQVRTRFVEETSPSLNESVTLGRAFSEARENVLKRLNLKSVEIKPELSWFLQDPVDGLSRHLFENLFSLLENKITLADFELSSKEIISRLAESFSHRVYLHWVSLSLMLLLAPDSILSVPLEDDSVNPDLNTADKRPGWYFHEVPEITSLDALNLDASQYTAVLSPRVIMHSFGVSSYVSMALDFHTVYMVADKLQKEMEWYKPDDLSRAFGITDLWPDMALYKASRAKALEVVADYENVARPDIVIEVREKAGWYTNEGIGRVQRHHHILRPRLRSFVISRNEVPEAILNSLPPEIQVLTAGLDTSKLVPIISKLSGSIQSWGPEHS